MSLLMAAMPFGTVITMPAMSWTHPRARVIEA
jgi:hypothetical protein